MIKGVQIKNFKSVAELKFELGNFNVLIGENGSGKSNILEAIAFGAAASADKLDFEFLGSRGIRVTNPEYMYSAFKNGNDNKEITIEFKVDSSIFDNIDYVLSNDKNNPKKWTNVRKEYGNLHFSEFLSTILFESDSKKRKAELRELLKDDENYISFYEKFADEIKRITKEKGSEEDNKDFFKYIFSLFLNDRYSNPEISNFIIYSPEQSSLRRFEETTQIYPIGIRGEGLFQYLKEISNDVKKRNVLNSIRKNLILLDWFEGFEFPKSTLQNEYSLKIKDRYLYPPLQYFDQRSTNEGFLYLLFYYTLFTSPDTPKFFAIDNIDNSLNPKLCMQLTRNLVKLAKLHKKQVIITTQNPAILDGLNLKDEGQRLFVVRRNNDGHTKAQRIDYKTERKMKLSDLWVNGYIGGLPENF